jgi:plasmid stabilization system protein ParE
VAVVELAAEVGEDILRILDHLQAHAAVLPGERIREIIDALNVLETSPRIGRPGGRGNRELIIGRHSHGYVALYRYVAEIDTVFVLALRSQREAGYAER